MYGIILLYNLINMGVIVENFKNGEENYLCAVNMGCIVLADLYLLYFESDLHKLLMGMQKTEMTKEDFEEVKRLTDKLKKYIYNDEDPLDLIVKQAEGFLKCSHENW